MASTENLWKAPPSDETQLGLSQKVQIALLIEPKRTVLVLQLPDTASENRSGNQHALG